MEYANHLNDYAPAPTSDEVAQAVSAAMQATGKNCITEVYRFLLSAIDLTTLSCTDSEQSVAAMARRAAEFDIDYPHLQNVASICVYPPFVETAGLAIDGTSLKITAVAGGFPSSQTFLEVKMLEVAMAIENGADEVDVVLNAGKILSGAYDEAANEIEVLREEAEGATLKVILETGALLSAEKIYHAALLAMAAGADFVKTSTGKIDISATPEAVVIMCQAIKAYHQLTSRKIGIKIAGGVRTPEQAALYYTIVEQTLGSEWLTTDLFRIGASSAANNILSAIEGKEVKYF